MNERPCALRCFFSCAARSTPRSAVSSRRDWRDAATCSDKISSARSSSPSPAIGLADSTSSSDARRERNRPRKKAVTPPEEPRVGANSDARGLCGAAGTTTARELEAPRGGSLPVRTTELPPSLESVGAARQGIGEHTGGSGDAAAPGVFWCLFLSASSCWSTDGIRSTSADSCGHSSDGQTSCVVA